MRRRLCGIFLALILCAEGAQGQVIAPKLGLEWGGAVSLYQNYHYNYLTEESMRVDEKGYELSAYLNGTILLNAGIYVGKHVSLDLYSGYQGVHHDIRIVPVGIKACYYFSDRKGDSDFLLASGGYGFKKGGGSAASLYRLGYGRRFKISRSYFLEFALSSQLCLDNPDVVDSFSGVPVTKERLRYSGAAYASLNFNIQFCF